MKNSILKNLYKDVSPKKPIYYRRDCERKRPIGSFNSKAFKFEPFICNDCNNRRTQKADRAWEKLSNFILHNWGIIKGNNAIDIKDAFGTNFDGNLLQVQLYFAKILGCKIVESGIDSHLDSLSHSILNETENSHLYLSFRPCQNNFSVSYSAISDIQVGRIENREMYMHVFCTFGCFSVDIIFSESVEEIELNGAQLPSEIHSKIQLTKVDYSQTQTESINKNDK